MVSLTPSERSNAKDDIWSAIPTTSRSLDMGAIFYPEADIAGLSWPESPMDRPPEGRPTPRTTSGKARTGLLGEGGLCRSSPCTIPLGWAWPEGKHTASCPARGALAHLSPERLGERGRTKGGTGSTPETQRGPPLPHRIVPKPDSPSGGSASIPLTGVSVSIESPPLGHGQLSGTNICPVLKEEAGAHVCLGCATGSPLGDWCETPPPCCLSWRWHECIRNGRNSVRARPFMCQARYLPDQTPQAGPPPWEGSVRRYYLVTADYPHTHSSLEKIGVPSQ